MQADSQHRMGLALVTAAASPSFLEGMPVRATSPLKYLAQLPQADLNLLQGHFAISSLAQNTALFDVDDEVEQVSFPQAIKILSQFISPHEPERPQENAKRKAA